MSVLVLDHKVFSYIHSGLIRTAYNRTADAMHGPTIYKHFENKELGKESKRLVKSWLFMNEVSYNKRYNTDGFTDEVLTISPLSVKPVQLLKYLEALSYNIEVVTNQPDFDLLEKWITDLRYAIISEMEEYKAAQWSEI